jgi:PII-like signaling protein
LKHQSAQVLCSVRLTNQARYRSGTLYQWILDTAHRQRLQGATVFKGICGLGAGGKLLREHSWRLSQELPVVIELVDEPAAIERLLTTIEPELKSALVTLERAHVAVYRMAGEKNSERDLPQPVLVRAMQQAASVREVKTVKIPEDGVLMRIFVGEGDRDAERNLPLYESIVLRARESELAGATVMKGVMGFGRHSRVHTSKLLELSTDLPIVIEIVDAEEKINAFVPIVAALVTEGLVTLEAIRVLKYVSPEPHEERSNGH